MAEDEVGGTTEGARADGPSAPDVSREARLLAEALAAGLGGGPGSGVTGSATGSRGAPPTGEGSGLAEVLAGAGLLARGGLELLGGAMSRWAQAAGREPDLDRMDGVADADAVAPGARSGPSEPSYRRTPVRPIPVQDDPRRTDLA